MSSTPHGPPSAGMATASSGRPSGRTASGASRRVPVEARPRRLVADRRSRPAASQRLAEDPERPAGRSSQALRRDVVGARAAARDEAVAAQLPDRDEVVAVGVADRGAAARARSSSRSSPVVDQSGDRRSTTRQVEGGARRRAGRRDGRRRGRSSARSRTGRGAGRRVRRPPHVPVGDRRRAVGARRSRPRPGTAAGRPSR